MPDHDDLLRPPPNELELAGQPPNAAERETALRNEHAEPFQWMPGSMDVSGGFVPKDAQRAN